jgi:hypothetical protein
MNGTGIDDVVQNDKTAKTLIEDITAINFSGIDVIKRIEKISDLSDQVSVPILFRFELGAKR